jgi:PTH1 family peptidyl-tRNA hydrolase
MPLNSNYFKKLGEEIAVALRGKPRLIIGLGNPGKEYEKTYHNVGILFIENKIPPNSKFQIPNSKNFEHLKTNILILVKPKTFMNESGKAVKEAIKYFKVKPEELLIVHDDSDIELGKYKISFGRGSAGHKGVQSIIDALGAKNFWRLRIGIGKAESERRQAMEKKAGEFVLKKITKEDLKILEKVFEEINYDKN